VFFGERAGLKQAVFATNGARAVFIFADMGKPCAILNTPAPASRKLQEAINEDYSKLIYGPASGPALTGEL
jgi:hypothetical protein